MPKTRKTVPATCSIAPSGAHDPIGMPVIGTVANIEGFTRQDLVRHVQCHYVAQRLWWLAQQVERGDARPAPEIPCVVELVRELVVKRHDVAFHGPIVPSGRGVQQLPARATDTGLAA